MKAVVFPTLYELRKQGTARKAFSLTIQFIRFFDLSIRGLLRHCSVSIVT